MKIHERDHFISRLRTGCVIFKYDNKYVKILSPTEEQNYFANIIYQESKEEAVENDVINDEYVFCLLNENGLWNEQKENELENILPKHIEYWKKELYKAALRGKDRETIRKYLDTAKKEYNHLFTIRHSLDQYTDSGIANYNKHMYLISETAYWMDGEKIDFNQIDINKILNYYNSFKIGSDEIREIARTTPWSNIYSSLKIAGKIFANSNLTDEQMVLINWSETYSKILEHPECPPDYMIEDDDILDGWLLIQKEKGEQNKLKGLAEKTISNNPKISNADDVFVVAQTAEDVKMVDALNNPIAARNKKQRLKQVSEQGFVKEQEFKDVQQRRSMQMTQAYSQSLRRK